MSPSHILVRLREHDRVEEMISCLEFVARPGMKVIFLIESRENLSPWWSEHITTFYTGVETATPIRRLEARIARQRQLLSAEEKVLPARKVLQAEGVAVSVELYSGSLRKITASYLGGDAETIMLLSGKRSPLWQLFATIQRRFGRFSAGGIPPLLLLRPGRTF